MKTQRFLSAMIFVFVFSFTSFAAEMPFLSHFTIFANCTSSSASAYDAGWKVATKTTAVTADEEFLKLHPELKKFLDRSGGKLKAQPPTEKEVAKATSTAEKATDLCAAEDADRAKKIDDKKKEIEGRISDLQAELNKLGAAPKQLGTVAGGPAAKAEPTPVVTTTTDKNVLLAEPATYQVCIESSPGRDLCREKFVFLSKEDADAYASARQENIPAELMRYVVKEVKK